MDARSFIYIYPSNLLNPRKSERRALHFLLHPFADFFLCVCYIAETRQSACARALIANSHEFIIQRRDLRFSLVIHATRAEFYFLTKKKRRSERTIA